jgi:hypothetical protein
MQSVFCAFWHSQELPLSLTVCRMSAACWRLYALGFSPTQFMVQCVRKPSHRSFCEMTDFCFCEDASQIQQCIITNKISAQLQFIDWKLQRWW